ncbi:uncharacterized protein LOC143019503 [Oratosquilla oratoria]|uniref:uncharacterized protein LOC143019503 n=1 Tax=Oratosquilla oratoria TaxID=337810 RepID=UPI003F75AD9F
MLLCHNNKQPKYPTWIVRGEKKGTGRGTRHPSPCSPKGQYPKKQRKGIRGAGGPRASTLRFGSFNVRGCGTDESKREEIGSMFVRRKLDVLALSLTKLKGKGECKFGRISGVKRGRGREGVAILVSEEIGKGVVEWKEVSSRIMWMKVKLGKEMWVFVSAYVPGSEKSMEEREAFWIDLNECIEGLGRNVNVIVLGDLNARVGNGPIDGVVGKCGVPGKNRSGELMVEMCLERELMITNTVFRKKVKHKYTWERVVEGRVVDRALMDYVVVNRIMIGRVKDVHVLRGEGGGISDHFLVEGKLRVEDRWRRRKGTKGREVLRVNSLNEKEKEYEKKLKEEWEGVKDRAEMGVEEEWGWFKEGVLKCARMVCGTRRTGGNRRKGSEWWDEETKKVVEEKKRAFTDWLQKRTGESYETYKEKKREVKQKVKEAKRRADVKWGRSMTENFESNKKMFWKEIKRGRGGESSREEKVKGTDGELKMEEMAVRGRWAEYFRELLNVKEDREGKIAAVGNAKKMRVMSEENGGEIRKDEVKAVVKMMKAGKAPGLDGCHAECLKKGGSVMVDWLVRLFNVCWREGRVPEDWSSACIVPLYKGKGDKCECSNFRGISLLSVVGKAYGRILIERIRRGTEGVIGEEQCGFRTGRGCVDQIFVVRQICEKAIGKGKDVFWAFMDLEKAYDRVDRKALWEVMQIYGIGGKLLGAVKSFYESSRACVRIRNGESEWFEVKVGLRQGCVMSPWLFNLYMDGVVREVNARVVSQGLEMVKENGEKWEVSQLLFADDTALVAGSEEGLRKLVAEFGRVCDRGKLKINVGKSKVMRCTRGESGSRLEVNIKGERLEEVDSFRYLGASVAGKGGVKVEVECRLREASKCLGGLKSVMRNRHLGMDAKRRLYEGVIVPTALYGAETWNIREEERRSLNVFEMRCLRSMVGVTRLDRVRNEENRGGKGAGR